MPFPQIKKTDQKMHLHVSGGPAISNQKRSLWQILFGFFRRKKKKAVVDQVQRIQAKHNSPFDELGNDFYLQELDTVITQLKPVQENAESTKETVVYTKKDPS